MVTALLDSSVLAVAAPAGPARPDPARPGGEVRSGNAGVLVGAGLRR